MLDYSLGPPCKSYEDIVNIAQNAVNQSKTECKQWLQILLNILKDKKYATIKLKNNKLIDVAHIARTYMYASFFDVFNSISIYDLKYLPQETQKLKHLYINIFRKNT